MANQNSPATLASIQQFSFFNPDQFATMQRVATMFASSELVPDMYQIDKVGKDKAIANNIIAIDIANRIEANILMVMQNLVIIYGKPSWSSKFLISTVNTCGRFESLKFKFEELGVLKDYKYKEYKSEWVTANSGKRYKKTEQVDKVLHGPIKNIQCIAYTTAKGSDDVLESSPVSVEMAINEGWYTKAGSKWKTMTRQMLMYRAASFWTSTYAPELSMGMKTEDELRDIVDTDYVEVTDEKPVATKEEKANKKEISIDDERSGTKKDEPKAVQKMTFASMDEAKKFLVEDCGAAEEFLTDDNRIKNTAQEHGIEIEIKAAGGPDF